MATTVEIINDLYNETIDLISQDSRSWQSFLKTASMNYTNSFSEQLLIYAQRPEAIATADIKTWNNTYKRFINTGCSGIGLLTEYNGNQKIKYVWGLNDTHSMYGRKGKQVKIWTVPKVYEQQIIERLENRFGTLENKDDFISSVKSLSNNLMEDNYLDYYNDLIDNKNNTRLENIDNDLIEESYKNILKNSIAYMMLNRSGIDPSPFFNATDFIDISNFQDLDAISRLGTSISDIAKVGIKEIYVALKNVRLEEIDKTYTFDKQNKSIYDSGEQKKEVERSDFYEHNIQKGRKISSTKSESDGRNTNGDGQIFNDEVGILEKEQERDISSNVDERNSNISFERDRNDITGENGINNETDETEIEYNRRNEEEQSNGMVGNDEQYQDASRRNNYERTNTSINNEDTEDSILFSYSYKIGDTVYIDDNDYQIEKIGIFEVIINNSKYISISRVMNLEDFQNKLREDDRNKGLWSENNKDTKEEQFYGEYNDEIDLINHILNKHKIYDINLDFNEDGDLIAEDDDNVWEGKGFYNFLFDGLFNYNDDGTVDLVDNKDLERLKEYRKKYDVKKEVIIPTEKEKVIVKDRSNTSQLTLFAPREQELADRLVDIFNSFDTKYKGTFYVDSIELEKWNHIKSNKRNLTITIKSDMTEEGENSFTYFNIDKKDETLLRESIEIDPFLKYLSKDKDFSINVTPDSFYIFYSKFDEKNIDLSIGRKEVLSSVNDDKNEEIIDNPELVDDKPKKKVKSRITNYILHPEVPYEERINYKIDTDYLGVGTPKERYRNNIEAIKVLKQCEDEDRYATPEEQEILSKYVGWGGLSKAFEKDSGWINEYNELKELLTDDEYSNAMNTTVDAFYTPPIVIRSMYKALEEMGLKKGNILDPSCGIGNFIGMMPNNDNLKIYGVEKDSISGRIARQLYQKSSIAIQGFEKVDYSNSFFDVVVGNVPFGTERLNDKKYDKYGFVIHDYFFAKTIDKVRSGGIIALITSKGTLDKENIDFRKYIAQRANLLGAIRLPDNTFLDSAGTTVTSDIIFLQKRDSITDIMPEWVNLDTNQDGIVMNKYFVDNPNMILGIMKMVSNQYGGYSSTCKSNGEDLGELLNNAIQNIHAELKDYQIEEIEEEDNSIEADLNIRNFSYTLIDDEIYYREDSRMYPQKLSATAENRVKGLIELRDITREIIDMQLSDYPDEDITKKQEELNDCYDKFTKKYGLINSRGNSTAFSNDSSYFLLCSLEILDENGNLARKADMFTKRTIKPLIKNRAVESARDALIISLCDKAKVDLSYIQSLCKMDMDKIIEELRGEIFRVPEKENPNNWVTADEYLSGNIREKLYEAEKFTEEDSSYNVNVEYLKKVIPKDIPAEEISVRIGTTWIPEDIMTEFMFDLFDSSYGARNNMKIHYSNLTGEWNIENKSYDRTSVAVTSTYGTNRANAYRLLEDALNLRDTKIFDYVYDSEGKKKAVLNRKETAIAQAKQDKIKQSFQDWIWNDFDRRERLTKLYNEKFNSFRNREYDGSHIEFEGMNPEIKLRTHQVNAIARILYGGNTLLAHEVGAGKTFEMVAAAMESKRLGLCNKSLFVVPNHIIEQFASEFLQLYPSANILVSTKKDFETKNRKKFCSRIATGDYDAIIIGHSQFEKIPMSKERQENILRQQLDDISRGIEDLKAHNGEKFSIKMLVKSRKSIEKKLEKLNDDNKKDDVVTFEELGVDRLFVDEAHYYKNLYLYTKMKNVGGLAQTEAQKSSDLFMKCRYLDELTNSKGVIFATGTPVSNSMAELYTMQRYLQYETLIDRNLQHFDAWASTFGETITAIELAPEGSGYRTKTRFARFYNLPELMTMFKEIADIQTSDMLNLPVPTAHYETIISKPSELQLELVKSFAERAEKVRNRLVDAHEDNMLKITNDGRKLSLDQRLINELLGDDINSKTTKCSELVYKIWEENKEDKLTQLVFCDLSTPKDDDTFNVYTDLKNKLIEKGIPENEIEFIHNAKTDIQKQEIFSKVRKGNIRVLLGSTLKMGAGTNCQDRLISIHHLDCPWLPSWFTQRDGRGIRQGNQNENIYIYRYITEKTFDAYLYQLVENKQKFISQIMTSKTPLRSAEDIDEVALSYAEIKALAAGNPLIIEKTELDSQVSKLLLLKQNFLSEQYSLESKVKKDYPNKIKQLENILENYKKDLEILNSQYSIEDEKFVGMTINGNIYYDKQEAGEKILEECKKYTNEEKHEIGQYKCFKMEIQFIPFYKSYRLYLTNNEIYSIELGTSDIGNITRIDNAIKNISEKITTTESSIDDNKKQLEKAKLELGKKFSQEDELKEKSKRLSKVNKLLNLDETTHEIMNEEEDVENVRQEYKSSRER
ncbi:MAG: SNF2-related protein [bacterium]|nr:SNF2-related protein [bacterium]